ncbi:hypothetical protein HK28_02140 [Acetobacter sp. DsW_063]|nr:hypothetical protein HK28_02140 [Acetobacter sp. DsW_063]
MSETGKRPRHGDRLHTIWNDARCVQEAMWLCTAKTMGQMKTRALCMSNEIKCISWNFRPHFGPQRIITGSFFEQIFRSYFKRKRDILIIL